MAVNRNRTWVILILELLEKDFKASILSIFSDLKERVFTINKSMEKSQQRSRNYKNEPDEKFRAKSYNTWHFKNQGTA